MKNAHWLCLFALWPILSCFNLYADESDLVTADRQALVDAKASGVSSKIIAAKEQLSDDLWREDAQRRKDMEGISIPLAPDSQVLINNKVQTSLIVDTGSPVIMLNSSFIKTLGLDLSQSNVGYVEVLNGKYKAATVILSSIKIGDIRVRDVKAAVLIDENPDINFGILGMSFLSNFHFTLDQQGQKLILKKTQ